MLRYFPRAFLTRLAAERRRLAPVVLLAGALVIGKLAYEEMPRGQELRFVLPPRPVSALRVTYRLDEEPYAGLERHFPHGAPPEIVHHPSLGPGRYELNIELTDQAGDTTRVTRAVQIPSEGSLRISLAGER